MTTDPPFGPVYAAHYDLMYGEKDYAAECDLLEALFARHARRPVRSVLDLGCGTGNHAIRLAGRGYRVTGVDRSERMLEGARRKRGAAGNPQFVHSEIQQLTLEREFDAVVMMFAVLGYLADEPALRQGLQAVRSHLAAGGLFIADFWYGPAVEAIGPSVRTLAIDTPDGPLLRTATPALDPANQRCRVHYQLTDAQGVLQAEESHALRYFFPDELRSRLATAGLELLELLPFPALEGTPDETSWNALQCACAR